MYTEAETLRKLSKTASTNPRRPAASVPTSGKRLDESGAGAPVADPEPRIPVAHLRARLGPSEFARVINLSSTGAGLETDRHLLIGEQLPLEVPGSTVSLKLDATVVWSRLVRTQKLASGQVRPVYWAGLSFPELSPVQQDALELLKKQAASRQTDGQRG